MTTQATTKSKSGFYIEVTCPGCGGKLDLDTDFFVLECTHCGSVHRVVMPDVPTAYMIPAKVDASEARFAIDRYLKKHSLPLTGSGMLLKKLYYPYWKVDAILFKLRNKIHERMIAQETEYHDAVISTHDRTEISLSPYTTTRAAGINFEGIPVSMGMRTEYVKLIPYATENISDDFDSMAVLTTWEDVRRNLMANVSVIGDIDEADFGSNITELFHPRASLVYFPFLVFESYNRGGFNRYVVDGVSGRVLDHDGEIESDCQFDYPDTPTIEFGALTVEHHRCPNCGVDLPAEQSYVYICGNCHDLIVLGGADRVHEELLLARGGENARSQMFPFWTFKIPEANAVELQKMFGGIHRSDRLVIPAFRTQNFDAIFRLAKRMSAAIPQLDLAPTENLDSRFLPVSVSLDEALMLGEIIVFRQSISRPNSSAAQERMFLPSEIKLVYVPFHPEHYFFVDSVMNTITFEKSLAR